VSKTAASRGLAVLYGNVTKADHARIVALAARHHGVMGELVRAAVDGYLDDMGEPPLEPVDRRGGRPKGRSE